MSHHSTDHEAEGGHDVHLPDPSMWPFVVGMATLLLGLVLIWWVRDPHHRLTGPLFGGAAALTLVSAAGWAYEDGRMRKKAEAGEMEKPRDARYTQVMTFAVPGEQVATARQPGGVISAVEASDSALHNLAGFQDLRIIASPAETGPAQVLIETTWSDREGLASYEETRQTLLDTLISHEDEVVPGSIQVFDMEVVRDTKAVVGFRFGLGGILTVFGSLIVFGLMVGAGLSLFQEDSKATATNGGDGGTPAPASNELTATDNKFDKATLEAAPNSDYTLTFKNNGKVPHNVHFLTAKGGQTLADGALGTILEGGKSEEVKFKTGAAGTYYFQCDVHPDQMTGSFVVKEGAASAGGAAAGGGAAAAGGAPQVVATDNKFDKTTLDASAGKELTVSFKNNGKVPHNIHFLDKKGGKTLADGAEGAILEGGKSETLKFTVATAGTYYFQCDVHPDQMSGTLNVK